MKPTANGKRWKGVKHCQRNPTRHGAYSAQVYSTRAFLRTFDILLKCLEAETQSIGASVTATDQSKGGAPTR